MIKWVGIATKPSTMSMDELKKWWLEIHAQNVKKLPGLRKYIVSFSVGSPDEVPRYDGIAELWFDDMTALQKAMESPVVAEAMKDLQSSKVDFIHLFTEEHTIT